jgi:hypothetical protein
MSTATSCPSPTLPPSTCVICLEEVKDAAKVAIKCSAGHQTCRSCLQSLIGVKLEKLEATTLLASQAQGAETAGDHLSVEEYSGLCHCPLRRHGCESTPFSNASLMMHLDPEVFDQYVQGKMLLPIAKRVQEVLQKRNELSVLIPNARQCGRCSFGPVDLTGCSDLAAHHGQQRSRGSEPIDNACARCGWFSPSADRWPRWDPSALLTEDPLQAVFDQAVEAQTDEQLEMQRAERRARMAREREEYERQRAERRRVQLARAEAARDAARRERERAHREADERRRALEQELVSAIHNHPAPPQSGEWLGALPTDAQPQGEDLAAEIDAWMSAVVGDGLGAQGQARAHGPAAQPPPDLGPRQVPIAPNLIRTDSSFRSFADLPAPLSSGRAAQMQPPPPQGAVRMELTPLRRSESFMGGPVDLVDPTAPPELVGLDLFCRLTGFQRDSQAAQMYLRDANGNIEAAVRSAVQGVRQPQRSTRQNTSASAHPRSRSRSRSREPERPELMYR